MKLLMFLTLFFSSAFAVGADLPVPPASPMMPNPTQPNVPSVGQGGSYGLGNPIYNGVNNIPPSNNVQTPNSFSSDAPKGAGTTTPTTPPTGTQMP